MLTILANPGRRFCDGVSRRGFLRIGALGLGGLSLSRLLQAEDRAEIRSNDRSILMIYLPGGPTQLETFDPKPAAPAEIRGSYGAVSTAVAGEHFCELLPKLARSSQLFSVVRSLTGMKNRHECFQCYTGRPGGRSEDDEPGGGWPALGSVASSLLGPRRSGVPAFIDASPGMSYGPYNLRGQHDASPRISWPGITGFQHTPFALDSEVRPDLILSGANLERLDDRRQLLSAFARFQHEHTPDGLDSHQQQAFGILTSPRLAEALDLEREPPRVRERYGTAQPTFRGYGGAPQSAEHLLLARRLIEAGARCVSVAFGAWDWHGTNGPDTIERLAKTYLPTFDHALSVLLEDMHERGLLNATTVVVWGEFGRTPRINPAGGRDHWPNTQSILLAGGGLQGGRVIGTTDRTGGVPAARPVHVQEVFATLYRNLGIDGASTTIPDFSGRPRYLVDAGYRPIDELS